MGDRKIRRWRYGDRDRDTEIDVRRYRDRDTKIEIQRER